MTRIVRQRLDRAELGTAAQVLRVRLGGPQHLVDPLAGRAPPVVVGIEQPCPHPVARGEEAVLVENLGQLVQTRRRVAFERLEVHQRLHERDERANVLERRLRVHDADLDRAEARLQAGIPPQERRLGDRAALEERVDRLDVGVVVRKEPRNADAREAVEDRDAHRGHPAVAALPER